MPTTFAVEKTLGRLGKWLRLMGFDTLSEIECPKGTFVQRIGWERILLTRTRRSAMTKTARSTIFIQANDPAEQVVELIQKASIRWEDTQPFSRCLLCNERIISVSRQAVLKAVPDYISNTQAVFSTCPKCGRVYWKGSHTERALKRLATVFSRPDRSDNYFIKE